MSTFVRAHGPHRMLGAVANEVARLEASHDDLLDVHTITLVLNGQHGEFDLTIQATLDCDDALEELRWTGVAHRSGEVADLKEIEV